MFLKDGMQDDTIAAIATPLGEGGIAVIRVSGRDALTVVERCFRAGGKDSLSQAESHTVHYGHVIRDETVVDEVLVTVMRAPRTYTREEVVEITCHGGLLPAKSVLDVVLLSGARMAEPGEFTRRAFLNGRLDLAQAEAVADLIHSRTELAMRAAAEQLAGKLSQRIQVLRDRLMDALAQVEAHIDFPEEDIAPDTAGKLVERCSAGLELLDGLLATANEGQILRRGVRAAIIGRPNAGKSSLLNELLGHDRAIVSPIPGTTRDTIEETANIRGVPVVFVDTAGLRDSGDAVELEGIRRSRLSYERAEFILHVFDRTEPFTPGDAGFLQQFSGKKRILVRNKSDLPDRFVLPEGVEGLTVDVSCATGEGIEALKDAIKSLIWSGQIPSGMLGAMINSRHEEALQRSRAALMRAREGLAGGGTLELVAVDLRIAVHAVGEIVGKTATEDLLDRIFSQFCIGK